MKVLIIDTVHPVIHEIFHANGYACDYHTELSLDEFSSIIKNYEGLILRSRFQLDKLILRKAEKLRFIGRVGAGMENIDLSYAKSKGIECFNSPEGNRDAVGEHALGMLLAMANNLFKANQEVKKGKWLREENRGFEINGKTIGIIGYGNMGSAFASKLTGIGAKVIAYDKYKSGFENSLVKEVSLEDIFNQTDILSIHVPLTEETHYMVNGNFINSFKKDFYLINTARGKIVNTKELVENMKAGKIKGAALDVLEFEKISFEELHKKDLPMEFEYLVKSDNVLLSPHIGGWTHESNYKLNKILANKIVKHFRSVSGKKA